MAARWIDDLRSSGFRRLEEGTFRAMAKQPTSINVEWLVQTEFDVVGRRPLREEERAWLERIGRRRRLHAALFFSAGVLVPCVAVFLVAIAASTPSNPWNLGYLALFVLICVGFLWLRDRHTVSWGVPYDLRTGWVDQLARRRASAEDPDEWDCEPPLGPDCQSLAILPSGRVLEMDGTPVWQNEEPPR